MAGLGLLVLIAGGIQRITAHGRAFPQGSSRSGPMAETSMGQREAAEIAISHYLMGLGVLLVVSLAGQCMSADREPNWKPCRLNREVTLVL